VVRALLPLLVLFLASCGSCNGGESASSGGRAPSVKRSVDAEIRTLAELRGRIDALAPSSGSGSSRTLFGISSALGTVFAIALEGDGAGPVREIAKGEKEPFALVVRAGKPVWASADGVYTCDEDGGNRRVLVAGRRVRGLGVGPHDVLYGDERAVWRIEWPAASTPIQVVDEAFADEVLATVEHVVWLEHGKAGGVWEWDLKSRTRQRLGDSRKPHDLSLSNDGRAVLWHEGEADLLPGRDPRAFLADTVTGAVRELAGEYASSSAYVLRGPCAFGPGICKPVALVDWIALDQGGTDGVVAADSSSLYWVETPAPDRSMTAWRIVGAPLASCCR
jgi:hypothetical protein